MWKTVKLGDICKLNYGKALDKKDRLENGAIPVYGANGIKAYTDKLLHDKPSIIIGRKGSAGELNKVAKPFWALDVTYYVTTDESIVDLDFLFYVLAILNLPSMARGVKPGINRNDVYDKSINLPSLSQQQRIVAKLDAAFAEIDRVIAIAKEAIIESSQIYQNALSDIFKNIEDCEPRRTLKDVAKEFGRGKSKHRPRNDERLFGDKIPFIQTGNVSNTKMYVDSYDKSYSEFGVSQSKIWGKGTVCITIAANIAELAILDIDACFPDSVIGVYPDKEITSSEYIFYLLSYFQVYIKNKSKGSAQQNINLGTFESEKFPFPANLIHQNRIVDKLNKLQKELGLYKSLQSKKLKEMHSLKSSMLKQALLPSEAA